MIRIYNTYVETFSQQAAFRHLSWIAPETFARLPTGDKKRFLDVVRTGINTSGKAGNLKSAYAEFVCQGASFVNGLVARGLLKPSYFIEDVEALREEIAEDTDPSFEIELQQMYCEWIEYMNMGPHYRLALRTFKIYSMGSKGMQKRRAARERIAKTAKPPTGAVYNEV